MQRLANQYGATRLKAAWQHAKAGLFHCHQKISESLKSSFVKVKELKNAKPKIDLTINPPVVSEVKFEE